MQPGGMESTSEHSQQSGERKDSAPPHKRVVEIAGNTATKYPLVRQ